ncbi:hypothetical protein [Sediminibacillus massiliensis]|uniref:hypothetical protein n=1 Tax=Sediminibacillus massiliensis TaxID=1926277 RepID=UPI00098857E5|nr:hypothetical protein [Sediminibacillus massiliensis]
MNHINRVLRNELERLETDKNWADKHRRDLLDELKRNGKHIKELDKRIKEVKEALPDYDTSPNCDSVIWTDKYTRKDSPEIQVTLDGREFAEKAIEYIDPDQKIFRKV